MALLVGLYLLVFLTGNKAAKPKLGIDLQGGTRVTLTARTPDGSKPTRDALDQALQIISSRVNGLGVSGSEVVIDGDNLVITVPGNDSSEARNLGQTARLFIRPVIGQPIPVEAVNKKPAEGAPGAPGALPAGARCPARAAGRTARPRRRGRTGRPTRTVWGPGIAGESRAATTAVSARTHAVAHAVAQHGFANTVAQHGLAHPLAHTLAHGFADTGAHRVAHGLADLRCPRASRPPGSPAGSGGAHQVRKGPAAKHEPEPAADLGAVHGRPLR